MLDGVPELLINCDCSIGDRNCNYGLAKPRISIIVLWIASVCKIFFASLSQSRAAIFFAGEQKKNVLLVIAHPDDESMFFAPSINYLTSRDHKVPIQQVKVVDHPDLQDGFGKMWNLSLIAKIVEEEVASHSIDLVLTFDRYGVSGHCNHRVVHAGVRKLLLDSRRKIEAWELVKAVVNGIRQMLTSRKWPLVVMHNRRISGPRMDEPINSAMIERWKNADALYSTPTGSNDDWYWLYAATKYKCLLVTNNEMGDHIFQLLGNDFFPRWKERHQVRFSFSEVGPVFHMPPPFSVVIQRFA